MTGWLRSGVKGKMDRIFKPSPGKILVSDKLGNAVESNKTVTNLLSELEEDSKIGNLSNLTTTNKTNLVSAINEINANSGGVEWEWNPVPFYEETLANQFNYNADLPYYAGKRINLTNIVQTNNKLTHLLLIIERVTPTYGNTTANNNHELIFALPVYSENMAYTIFGKTASTTDMKKTKHFLVIKPYYGFTKVKYFYYQLSSAHTDLDPNCVSVSNLESPFEDILVNDLILYNPFVSIASDLGVGTKIQAFTKKNN